MKELKSEIARLARKDARAIVEPVRKASALQRSLIADLRRQVDAMQKELNGLKKAVPAPRTALQTKEASMAATLDRCQGRQGPAQAPGVHTDPVRQTGRCEHSDLDQAGRSQGQGSDPESLGSIETTASDNMTRNE